MNFKEKQGLWWKKNLVKVKAWTYGQKGEPFFPKDYEIITSDILQVCY